MPQPGRITNDGGTWRDVLILREGSTSVQRFSSSVQEISRPGMVGADFATFGPKATAFSVATYRDAASASEARQFAIWCLDTVGELIKYRDEDGYDWESDDGEPVMVVRGCKARWRFEPGTGFIYPIYNPALPLNTSQYGIYSRWMLQLSVEPSSE